MRTWYEHAPRDISFLIGYIVTPLTSLFYGKKDAEYVHAIYNGMSEFTKCHLRNLLVLPQHPDFAHEVQESDDDGFGDDSDGDDGEEEEEAEEIEEV